jgi:hypothetical protein
MPEQRTTPIAIDTLGRLRDHGYALWGSCLDCAALYRKDVPAGQGIVSSFDIDLDDLIAENGEMGSEWTNSLPLYLPQFVGFFVELPPLSRIRGGLASDRLRLHLDKDFGRPLFKIAEQGWAEPAFGIEFAGMVNVPGALFPSPFKPELMARKGNSRKDYDESPVSMWNICSASRPSEFLRGGFAFSI